MENKIVLDGTEYQVFKNVRDGYNSEELKNKYTDYFKSYDYIVGDWAYGKLRLKGFYEDKNKKTKAFNNIKHLDDYLKKNCAFNCKYFVIKRVYKK